MNTYVITNARTGQKFQTNAASVKEAIKRVDALFGWAFVNLTIKKGV